MDDDDFLGLPWPITLFAAGISSFIAYILTQVVCFFLWLKDGIWYSTSCLAMLQLANPDWVWLFHPDSWIGFHSLLHFFNVGVGFICTIYSILFSIYILVRLTNR
jgi:hypothetical protein